VRAEQEAGKQPSTTCVSERWPSFRERAEEAGGLPKFVVREFEEFLKCGIAEEGCLHLVCRSCGYSEVVALSCKKRGFCPSCLGRRMADTAVHLEQRVLPAVRIRHWICSLPWGLRALLGYDRELCAEVVSAFQSEPLAAEAHTLRRFGMSLRAIGSALGVDEKTRSQGPRMPRNPKGRSAAAGLPLASRDRQASRPRRVAPAAGRVGASTSTAQ